MSVATAARRSQPRASFPAIVAAVERITGKPVPVRMQPRRPGDPAALWAAPGRAQMRLRVEAVALRSRYNHSDRMDLALPSKAGWRSGDLASKSIGVEHRWKTFWPQRACIVCAIPAARSATPQEASLVLGG